jgi:hypothetical protein
VALLLSLVFTPAGSAEEPSLLYATAAGGTKLVAFNLQAGSVRIIGDTGFPGSLSLAFCRPGGRPYTITNMSNASLAQLASLDQSTGAATLVGSPLGQNLWIMGMTCSPDGTLYAVGQTDSNNSDFNSLYTVDRETGLASRVGSTGVLVPGGVYSGFFMALDFAPDGTLYGANTSGLYSIEPLTGQATKVVDFVGVTMVMGLAIGKDWTFYVSDYVAQSSIYAVDVTTGAATPVLNTGLAKVHNISFKTPGSAAVSSARGGPLNVRKECSTYTGHAGEICTITSSNLKAIPVGSTVRYAQDPVDGLLDSDVILDPPNPGNNLAFGHCRLSLVTGVGTCRFSGGTGMFTWFHAEVDVSPLGWPDFAWDGTYHYDR